MSPLQQQESCKGPALSPAELIVLELLENGKLWGGQVRRLAQAEQLALHKHECLKREEVIVVVAVPVVPVKVEFACSRGR